MRAAPRPAGASPRHSAAPPCCVWARGRGAARASTAPLPSLDSYTSEWQPCPVSCVRRAHRRPGGEWVMTFVRSGESGPPLNCARQIPSDYGSWSRWSPGWTVRSRFYIGGTESHKIAVSAPRSPTPAPRSTRPRALAARCATHLPRGTAGHNSRAVGGPILVVGRPVLVVAGPIPYVQFPTTSGPRGTRGCCVSGLTDNCKENDRNTCFASE